MLKRKAALFAVITLALSLVAGCPRTRRSPAEVGSTASAAKPAAPAADDTTGGAAILPEATPPQVEGVVLIDRKVLFGNPDKASARISPDGKQLAYLAPRAGVLNIFVGPLEDP